MSTSSFIKVFFIPFLSVLFYPILAQSKLLPVLEWHRKSEALIVKPTEPWIIHGERSDFKTTPDDKETVAWHKKLAIASPLVLMRMIGKSEEGRVIYTTRGISFILWHGSCRTQAKISH